MERTIIFTALVLFALAPFGAQADILDQFNDSYYVVPGEDPPDLSEQEGVDPSPGDGSDTSSDSANTESDTSSNNTSSEDTSSNNSSDTSTGEGSGGSDASDVSGGSEGGGDAESAPSTVSEEDALDSLSASGGISVSSGASGGSGIAVSVDGAAVRRALREKADIGSVLAHWRSVAERKSRSADTKLTTGEYYALVAATLAGDDAQIDSATFDGIRFEITYRSRGALLWFLPWSFPVRVTVNATAVSAEERVQVALPWYHWFLREFFTREGLASEIDSVVISELRAADPETEEDIQVRLFIAVADFLRAKVRTISDSILLGAR